MIQHKICVGNEDIYLQDNSSFYLNIESYSKLNIKVNNNVDCKLIIVGTSNYDINITLFSNSKLIVNSLNQNNSVNVNIELKEKAIIIYNHSVTSNVDSLNSFNIVHLENASSSTLNNNGINLSKNKLFFNINGNIPSNLSNISCSQNSKIINFQKGNSKIIPNLIVDSNDIVANHSAYIGVIDENEMFYLKSRGISEEKIRKLIYKATLLGKMDLLEEKEEFNKLIEDWW